MTHQWHDAYRHAKTPAHHLDPRSKLLGGLGFIFIVLCTPLLRPIQTVAFAAVLVLCAALARLSPFAWLSRVVTLLPFIAMSLLSMTFSHLGVDVVIQIASKSLLSVGALTLLALTTPFPDMLRALQEWHLPRALILFLAFLYRYAAVVGKEMVRVERGWAARYFGRGWWRQWMRLGNVIAALLVRSYERAERVYAAMLARGFSSENVWVHVLHYGWEDAVFLGSAATLLGIIRWGPLP